MFENFIELLKNYCKIVIHRHSHPDGDALGSQLGLAALIRDNFPGKVVKVVGDAAGSYAFMDGAVMDELPDSYYDGALAILTDCATEELTSDKRFKLAARSVRIDHHIYCGRFTDEEIIDPSFESASGMIAELAREQHLKLSKQAATAMFTGIVTDSGRFRFDSATARTFELAAMLLGAGVDTNSLYLHLYSRPLDDILFRAAFLQKIRIFEDSSVAYIYNTKAEIDALGSRDALSVARGMVNVMADIEGVDIWVNFAEDGEKVIAELRSSKYNINPIAVKYGGGGHQKACGADVKDRAEAMQLLAELKALAAGA